MNTATIQSHQVQSFKAFVAKKNAKAVKLGCPAIEVQYSAPYTVIKMDENGEPVEFSCVDLTIDESQIRINGYSVLGRIDDVDGSIIVSGYSDMSKYRNVSMARCDHCNVARNRNHLVLLGDEAGNEKVVGSTCLKDFTGHMSALEYLSYYSWAMGLQDFVDSEFGGTVRATPVYKIKDILALGVKCINSRGFYVSRKRAMETGEDTTRDGVCTILFNKEVRADNPITEAELNQAQEALDWYNSAFHTDTDFHYNVKTLLEKEYVGIRYFGFILAILPLYANSKEKDEVVPSQHIGQVGQKKVKMPLVLKNSINLGQYTYGAATTFLYIFKSGDNFVTYKTAQRFEDGVEYMVEATIKDHTEYKGIMQTVITRAKILSQKEQA